MLEIKVFHVGTGFHAAIIDLRYVKSYSASVHAPIYIQARDSGLVDRPRDRTLHVSTVPRCILPMN
jgi:hypothetical protein